MPAEKIHQVLDLQVAEFDEHRSQMPTLLALDFQCLSQLLLRNELVSDKDFADFFLFRFIAYKTHYGPLCEITQNTSI